MAPNNITVDVEKRCQNGSDVNIYHFSSLTEFVGTDFDKSETNIPDNNHKTNKFTSTEKVVPYKPKVKSVDKVNRLMAQCKELQKKTEERGRQIDKLFLSKRLLKFLSSLRDLNKVHRLVSFSTNRINFNQTFYNDMVLFPYCLAKDSESLKKYKLFVALTELRKMADDCKAEFARQYGSEFLTRTCLSFEGMFLGSFDDLSDEDKKNVADWWSV
jgi:hypothetical protein